MFFGIGYGWTILFATGHIALGYILGKTSARITKTKYNIYSLFALAILPDIDIIIPEIRHRGPFHSIFVIALFFVPLIIAYKKTAIPYIIATEQHVLSDYIAGGGEQLLWPVNQNLYGLKISLSNPIVIMSEWILFLGCLTIMIKTRDLQELIKPHLSNLILLIPIYSTFSPVFLQYPINVPNELIIPHLFFLATFSLSIIVEAQKLIHLTFNTQRESQCEK